MKTLRLRIVTIFALSFIGASLAMLWISALVSRRLNAEFFEGSMKLELEQAQKIYESGGAQGLAAYLMETDAALGGTRYLTNAEGHDLVSGDDHSRMLPTGFDLLGFPREKDGKDIIVRSSSSGRYHLIVAASPPLPAGSFIPYFLALAIVTGFLGWALSFGIFSPLKRVSGAVDCFGKGDLSARVVCERKDEIGDLARSFNAMADRLQILLTSERRLLQDVSHELRSPLSRLSFAVELMKNTEDREAAAGRVRREISRLSHLVSTLLEVSSSEADLSSREVQHVSMTSLTEAIVDDCSFEAGFRGVRVETQMRSCAIVLGDSDLLGRAIENVLRNAIRFSPPELPVVVHVDDKDSAVEIRVRDYGPGVPEDLLVHIFDPFFRVDESRDSAAGGIGFGLSIARRAVQLHRGAITATNALPGLEVNITIPALT